MSHVMGKLYEAVLNANPDEAKEAAAQVLREKIDPLRAIEDGLVKGIREVGDRFGRSELFLADLVMSAEAFKEGIQILEPELSRKNLKLQTIGTVVLGTVAGDIHSIGKDMVGVLLSAAGFKVHDLGVDVPTEKFIQNARQNDASILGASALLSTSVAEQKKIAEAMKGEGLRDRIKLMIGGAAVSEHWAKEVGADGWALSGPEGVEIAKQLMAK